MLYTLNDFDVISSFWNLNDLGSLTSLRGHTELQCPISSKNLNPNYLVSKWPILVQLFGIRPQKNHILEDLWDHFYFRLWRPCSTFKINFKVHKSNGGVLRLCYCLIFLSTYWFCDILSQFKNLKPRWDTLYNHCADSKNSPIFSQPNQNEHTPWVLDPRLISLLMYNVCRYHFV